MKSAPQSFRQLPLTALFAAPAHTRVLRELVLQGAAMSVSQLSRTTRLTMAAVRVALGNLEAAQAVRVSGEGRSRVFEVRPGHTLLPALKTLFLAERDQWVRQLDRLRQGLAGAADVRAAWLYGSLARADDGPSSDVDIAVLARADRSAPAVRRLVEDLTTVQLDLPAAVVVVTPSELARGSIDAGWFEGLAHSHTLLKGRAPRIEHLACIKAIKHDEDRSKQKSGK